MMRIALITTALFVATPAAAQVNLDTVASGAVLGVCVGAMDGSFDMNNVSALDQWGLTPGSATLEAQMRADLPGVEVAQASFDSGSVFVGYVPGQSCAVQIKGDGRIAARDALIHMMLKTGIQYEASTTDSGAELLAFPFSTHPIWVYTTTQGMVMVQVR